MARRGATKRPLRAGPGRLVVLGASMGGVEALRAIFAGLPSGLDAAFVIVLHRSAGITVLPTILSQERAHSVAVAQDRQPLERSGMYVAPGGLHTRVEGGALRVAMGPRENGHRPSVDVLFRSAAQSFGARVIGVVLSGALDCGAEGLLHIKRRGGLAIVQEPSTALSPEMPYSALDRVQPDHVAAPAAIGPLLARLIKRPPPRDQRPPRELGEKLAALVCPECNGPIYEQAPEGYRCRVGHRFSSLSFFNEKEARLESALWEALNIMQERALLSNRMAARARENGQLAVADRYESRARDTEENAALLRDLVYRADGMLPGDQAGNARPRRTKGRRGPSGGV